MTKEQNTELEKMVGESWEKINHAFYDSGGVNPTLYRLGFRDCYFQLQDRITWLETANAFHLKAAHDAVQEQNRLIKENTTLLEVIQEQERAKDILLDRIKSLEVARVKSLQ